MIKAIETVYNGYRFRSRLEARWGVFFKSIGIEYRYEPEGFDLDGTWYLPDFYLPQINYWIEVKPVLLTVEEWEKAVRLCIATQQNVMTLSGDPGLDVIGHVFIPMSIEVMRRANRHPKVTKSLYWTTRSNFIHIMNYDDGENQVCGGDIDRGYMWTYGWFGECNQCKTIGIPVIECINGCKGEYETEADRLIAAYTAARQARFEHGEKP